MSYLINYPSVNVGQAYAIDTPEGGTDLVTLIEILDGVALVENGDGESKLVRVCNLDEI